SSPFDDVAAVEAHPPPSSTRGAASGDRAGEASSPRRRRQRRRAAPAAVPGQRPGHRMPDRAAFAVEPPEQRLLDLVPGALLVGEVHGPPEGPGLLVPVRPTASGTRLPGGVLLLI